MDAYVDVTLKFAWTLTLIALCCINMKDSVSCMHCSFSSETKDLSFLH